MTADVITKPRPSDQPEVQAMWDDFYADRSELARERLIVQYSPLVKYVAGRVWSGLPRSVDRAELVSHGMVGLNDAINKFDPSRGFKFETYAMSRIKGAIIDELRAADWVPRSIRAKARNVERAMAELQQRLDRTPSDDELAEFMGIETSELQHTLSQIATMNLVALDDPFGDETQGATLGETLPDESGVDPLEIVENSAVKEVLVEAINRMGEREKTVILLYYFEGMTLAQIGEILGVTESRVSQIHTKAVLGLRTKMNARFEA